MLCQWMVVRSSGWSKGEDLRNEKRAASCLDYLLGIIYTTQLHGDCNKPLVIRIPMKQPGFNGQWEFFFSWLIWKVEGIKAENDHIMIANSLPAKVSNGMTCLLFSWTSSGDVTDKHFTQVVFGYATYGIMVVKSRYFCFASFMGGSRIILWTLWESERPEQRCMVFCLPCKLKLVVEMAGPEDHSYPKWIVLLFVAITSEGCFFVHKHHSNIRSDKF